MKNKTNTMDCVRRRALGGVLVGADGVARVAISSETPCPDNIYIDGAWRDCNLSLSHAEGAIDMERIRDGIALKDGHWSQAIVARAMSPSVEDGKLVARDLVWSAAPDAQILRQDFDSGVLRDISVEAFFSYADCEIVGETDGVKNVVCRKWTPLCAAFVVNGADPNAGIARELGNAPGTAQPTPPETEAQPPAATPAATTVTVKEEKKHMDPKDIQKVYDLARKFEIAGDTISAWLGEGKTYEEVKDLVLAEVAQRGVQAKPATPVETAGLGEKELAKYSLIAAIRSRLPVNDPDYVDAGFERECSQEIARKLGRQPKGMFIPAAVLARDFTSNAAVGGKLIATEYMGGAFIEKLRSKLVLADLGVRYLPGLVGDVAIPKQLTSATGYYIDNESEGVTKSNPTVGLIGFSPKTYGARTLITRKMLKQTNNPSADAFVQEDILQVCARGIQNGAIYGTGTSGQPAGLVTNLVKRTNAASFQEIVDMESAIETPNDEEQVKWLTNRKVFGDLRVISKDVGSGQFVAVRDRTGKYIDDLPALLTSDVAERQIFLGDWSQLIVALWGTLDISLNPYAADDRGALLVTALQDFDVGVRHAESFVWAEFPASNA